MKACLCSYLVSRFMGYIIMYKVFTLIIQSILGVYMSTIFKGFQLSFKNTNDYFLNPRMLNVLYKNYLISDLFYAFFFIPKHTYFYKQL